MISKQQIEYFDAFSCIERDTFNAAKSVYEKWDLAAANIKLFTQQIKPTFKYLYKGEGKTVVHDSGSKLYDNIFLSSILSTFATSEKAVLEWVKLNYKPKSGGVFLEIIKECRSSIFKGVEVTAQSEAVTDYLNGNNFELAHGSYSNFVDFYKIPLLDFLFNEPSGILAIYPIGRDINGKLVMRTSLVPSSQRVNDNIFYDGNYLIYSSIGKLQVYDRATKSFVIFNDFTDGSISEKHGLCFVPMRGVVSECKDSKLTYIESFLNFLVPHAQSYENEALLYEFMKFNLAPVKTTYEQSRCGTCEGVGSIHDEKDNTWNMCHTCKGAKVVFSGVPFGDTVVREVSDGGFAASELFKFTGDAHGYLLERATRKDKALEELKEAGFVNIVKLVQSGEAKKEDRKPLYNFMEMVMSSTLDVIEEYIKKLIMFLAADDTDALYKVVRPKSASMKTREDVLKEYNDAVASGLSPSVLNTLYDNVVASSESDRLIKDTEVIKLADPYVSFNWAQKKDMVSLNLISKFDYYLSNNAQYLLNLLYATDNALMEVEPYALSFKLKEFALKEYESAQRNEFLATENALNFNI